MSGSDSLFVLFLFALNCNHSLTLFRLLSPGLGSSAYSGCARKRETSDGAGTTSRADNEPLQADTDACTLRIVGTVAHRLEKEIEAAAVSAATMRESNTRSAVDTLRKEIEAHLSQNRADFKC